MSLPNKKLNLFLLAAQGGDGTEICGRPSAWKRNISTKTAESQTRQIQLGNLPRLLMCNSQACISYY
jgi:hypothetical protein